MSVIKQYISLKSNFSFENRNGVWFVITDKRTIEWKADLKELQLKYGVLIQV